MVAEASSLEGLDSRQELSRSWARRQLFRRSSSRPGGCRAQRWPMGRAGRAGGHSWRVAPWARVEQVRFRFLRVPGFVVHFLSP